MEILSKFSSFSNFFKKMTWRTHNTPKPTNNFWKNRIFWKVHLRVWVCCGCVKPFFWKFLKSSKNLEDFPYLGRFHTISTSEDTRAWNIPKIAFTGFTAKIRYFWCFLSTLSEMHAEVPKRAGHTPKIFLGVEWVHKTPGKKRRVFHKNLAEIRPRMWNFVTFWWPQNNKMVEIFVIFG